MDQGRAGRPRDPRLDAAIGRATIILLEERGYRELTITGVAELAGTTTAAIYRRWRSKSDLVAHAVFRTDGDDVVADTGDVTADIVTMVRWSVDKLCRPAALAALAGLLGEPEPLRAARATEAATAVDLVAERLRRAQHAGEIRADIDPRVISAMVSGPVIQAALSGLTGTVDDAWIADLVSVLLDGVRSTPARPGTRRDRRAPRATRARRIERAET